MTPEVRERINARERERYADDPEYRERQNARRRERKAERREKAQEIWEAASSGESFPALAEEHSEAGTREDGGLFGPLHRDDLTETLAAPAFTLPAGGISELMETPYGFHIIKVVSRIEDHIMSLEEVRDRIRLFLQEKKTAEELDVAVGQQAGAIPGPVEARSRLRAQRVGDEPLRGRRRLVEIASGQSPATDAQLSENPGGSRIEVAVEDVDAGTGKGPADGHVGIHRQGRHAVLEKGGVDATRWHQHNRPDAHLCPSNLPLRVVRRRLLENAPPIGGRYPWPPLVLETCTPVFR